MSSSEVKSFYSFSSDETRALGSGEILEKVIDDGSESVNLEADKLQIVPTTSEESADGSTDSSHCLHEGSETVLELLGKDGRFTKFLKKIGANNAFEGDLGDPREEWTIFAPTDKAFSKLQKSHQKYSEEKLQKISQYHVVRDFLTEDDFETTPLVPTAFVSSRLEGHPQRLLIESYKNHFYINYGVTVKETDMEARNGVVHVINEVILPPNRMLKQLKEISKEFTIFIKAVEKTGLEKEFNANGITGFIPTNYAFKGLGRKALKHLFSSYGIMELRRILINHLSTKLIYSTDLKRLLRRGDLGKKKGKHNDRDLPPRRGRRHDRPSRGGRRPDWDDEDDYDDYPRRGRGRRDDEPGGRFPPRRGGRRWDDEPESRYPPRRGGKRWDDEPNGRFPPRRGGGGKRWDDEPNGRFPPRRGDGGRRWDDEPEGRFPPRRGGRHWDDEPEGRFPPRRGGRHWDDEPDDRFPPRRGGRHWDEEPDDRFPPRRGGRHWDDEPDDRFPPRRGGRHWDDEPDNRFPPRRGGGGRWDDQPEGRLPRRGGHWEDEERDRYSRHRNDDYISQHQDSEKNVELEENKNDCSSDCLAGNCSKHSTISRRRSESWDDLKEELENIENHQTKADKGKCITEEPERNENSPEFDDRLDEEYDETIYKVDFPSKLCGEKFQLEVIDDEYHDEIEITVNKQARVLVADGVVENGVIHVIDRVLLPRGIKLPKILWHDFQRHAF